MTLKENSTGGHATFDLILERAANLFASGGYQRTSMDDIARSVGVTKAALYHYFQSKADVLFQIHSWGNNLGLERMKEAHARGRTATEKLELMVAAYFDHFSRNLDVSRLLTRSIDLHTEFRAEPEKLAIMMDQRKKIQRFFESVIAEGMAAGEFALGDSSFAAKMILGALNWATTWYRPEGKLNLEDATSETVKLLTRIVLAKESMPVPGSVPTPAWRR